MIDIKAGEIFSSERGDAPNTTTMSGRWRSRHWRQDDANNERQKGQDDGYGNDGTWGGRGGRGDGVQHHHHGGHYGDGYRHRDGDYQRPPYNHQQQQQQQRQQQYHPPYQHQQSNQREWSDNRNKWRRGQSLPVPPQRSSSSYEGIPRGANPNNSNQRMRGDEQHLQNQRQSQNNLSVKQEYATSNNRANSAGRPSQRPAPPNAWGKPTTGASSNTAVTSEQAEGGGGGVIVMKEDTKTMPATATTTTAPAASVSSVVKKQNAWGKRDGDANTTTTTTNNTSTTSVKVKEEEQSTANATSTQTNKQAPWSNSATNSSFGIKVEDEYSFPSLSSGGGAARGKDAKVKVEPTAILQKTPQNDTNTESASSAWGNSGTNALPVTSGWGKKKPMEIKKEVQIEEFPSLAAAAKAPKQQSNQQSPSLVKTDAAVSTVTITDGGGKTKSKNKGSRKKVATANLASFLSPHLATSVSNNKSSAKSATVSKSNTVGVKRSAPTSTPSVPTTGGNNASRTINSCEEPHHFHHPSMNKSIGTPATKKGRQRLAPRKKKLTTLKKRVLEERLRVWKERNDGSSVDDESAQLGGEAPLKRAKIDGANDSLSGEVVTPTTTTLLIENFVRPDEDDLTDDDEYDELLSNVISLAESVGRVVSVFVPRPSSTANTSEDGGGDTEEEAKYVGSAFVKYAFSKDANAGNNILDGVIVGGQPIRTFLLLGVDDFSGSCTGEGNGMPPSAEEERKWNLAVMRTMSERQSPMRDPSSELTGDNCSSMSVDHSPSNTIVFHKILCDDDYEDEGALQESLDDIKSLAIQYGQVTDARAATTGRDKGDVYISYKAQVSAEKAVQQLNGVIVGGSNILVSTQLESPHYNQPSGAVEIILSNVLNESDFEDEDCMNESIEDISNMARKYGLIGKVYAQTSGEQRGNVRVEYLEGEEAARRAAQQLNGLTIGGVVISATAVSSSINANDADEKQANSDRSQPEKEAPPPMYSGDKIIPERFAACKRVPKIPNAGIPRSYASKINDERATPLLVEMLGELMRLQERSKDDKNARARRRLVMGLREVARGIRAHKVKMVVMANNLDEYGAIDSKLQEILDMARAEDLPILYELNKRRLGKAIGKSIKVSVVGIQNADGAHEPFKKLKRMLGMA